jgi:hypothetical protein
MASDTMIGGHFSSCATLRRKQEFDLERNTTSYPVIYRATCIGMHVQSCKTGAVCWSCLPSSVRAPAARKRQVAAGVLNRARQLSGQIVAAASTLVKSPGALPGRTGG